MIDASPAQLFARRLVELYGPEAHRALSDACKGIGNLELGALLYDWETFWAREKQRPPPGHWRSWGFLGARRLGKTRACAEWINAEVLAGRAMWIGMMAQTEDNTFEVMIEGPTGLIATSPPWFKARYERERVVWPNGAQAFPFTPEAPGNIRGHGVEIFWASELQSWPTGIRGEEAWYNCQLLCSQGYARTVWDCTPKRRHPILRMLLQRAELEPEVHHVVRGTIWENEAHLAPGVIADLEKAMGGTMRGREELHGEYMDSADGALWQQKWIDDAVRALPTKLKRRILALDPGRSEREEADPTGYIELGLGIDDQVHVIADRTTEPGERPERWVPGLIDRYIRERCDCIVVEEESGGFWVYETIRLHAEQRGLRAVKLAKDALTRHAPSTIYVKSMNTQQRAKEVRATPVAAAYERGLVSHTIGADLEKLEDELTTWEPDRKHKSPNRLDALVWGVRELLGIADEKPDHRAGFVGIVEANRELQRPSAGGSLAALIGGGGRGRTI